MIKAIKTLIRKFVNILINLKQSPLLTLKYIFKYLFVRYIYRTLTWAILTVVLGNSFFERNFLESITNVLSTFWNSVKNLGWNVTVFIEYHIRSFLSWITNKDFTNSPKPDNNNSWFNKPWGNNSSVPQNPTPPSSGGSGGGSAASDYESFRKKQEAEWLKRMREEHPPTRNPWDFIKLPEDSNGWLWLGIGGLAVGALGFGIYSYWDSIGPYISFTNRPNFPGFPDLWTPVKNFGTSSYLWTYSAVETLWRWTPWAPSVPAADEASLRKGLDELDARVKEMKAEEAWNEEIRMRDVRRAARGDDSDSESSTPTGPSGGIPSHVIREINPFDAGTPTGSEGPFRPKLTLNTNTGIEKPEVLSSTLNSNPDPFSTKADPDTGKIPVGQRLLNILRNPWSELPGNNTQPNPEVTPIEEILDREAKAPKEEPFNPFKNRRGPLSAEDRKPFSSIWTPTSPKPETSSDFLNPEHNSSVTQPQPQPEPIIPKPPVTQQGVPIVQPADPSSSAAPIDSNTDITPPSNKKYSEASYTDTEFYKEHRNFQVKNTDGTVTDFVQTKSGLVLDKNNNFKIVPREQAREILELLNKK